MDIKNKKILGELVINSRIPLNRLAKKVGLSREVVTYRIKQLEIKNIITGFHAIINEEKLGYLRDTCFIQLKGISPAKEKQFLEYLSKHPSITYVGTVVGKWNVTLDIISKNREETNKTIKEIRAKAKGNLSILTIAGNTISVGYYPEKIFGAKRSPQIRTNRETKPDKTDLKILKFLTQNSRIEYSELSKKLNMTANAIKYRIKNLEQSNIIERYTISTNIKELGYSWYNIQIKLIKEEKEVQDFLEKNKVTIYQYYYIGNENWDTDIGIIIKNYEELRDFIIRLKERFPESIQIHDVYIVLDTLKENILPEKVFE